jgi:hypothetical protein
MRMDSGSPWVRYRVTRQLGGSTQAFALGKSEVHSMMVAYSRA